MNCKAKSCATCTRTCRLVHGRKSSSPVVASFFKVMLGDDFSRVLYLPPRFASEMSGFIGENAFLEDSNGRQWDVTISNVNGSLAFHQGWNNFAASHDLELGDFVVFFQLTEFLFVVKIYDKTACERVSFSKKCYQRKRRNDGSTVKDGPSTSVTPCSDFEAHCMINRNLEEKQRDDRICILDLSLFEKLNYPSREVSTDTRVTSGISPLQVSPLAASGALHSGKDSSMTPISWHLLPMSVNGKALAGDNQVSPYQKLGSNHDNRQSAQKKCGGVSGTFIIPTSVGIKNCKRMKVIKEEPVEIISDTCSHETIKMLPAPGGSNIPSSIGTKDFQSAGKIMSVIKAEPVEIISATRSQETTQMLPAPGASNTPSSIGTKDFQSGKIMNVIEAEPVEIKSAPCSQKTSPNVCGGPLKLTKSEYFRSVSMSVRQNSRVAQVAKSDKAAQVAKANGVAQVAKTDRVSQVAKSDRVSQVAKTDMVGQVVKNDRAAQMEKTDKFDQDMKTDAVVQVVKTEVVDLVGTENCPPVLKIIKEEPKPVENTSLPCSQETMGKPCKELSTVTKDVLPKSTVPQVVVKTEITDLESPQSRVRQVVVKTEIIDLDEISPTFPPLLATCSESFVELPEYLPFPIIKGRATGERKTVILRDPAKRLWPVLYHGRPSLKCLAFGWGALSKANRIKSGDQCRFTLEDENDGMYNVAVVPK